MTLPPTLSGTVTARRQPECLPRCGSERVAGPGGRSMRAARAPRRRRRLSWPLARCRGRHRDETMTRRRHDAPRPPRRARAAKRPPKHKGQCDHLPIGAFDPPVCLPRASIVAADRFTGMERHSARHTLKPGSIASSACMRPRPRPRPFPLATPFAPTPRCACASAR